MEIQLRAAHLSRRFVIAALAALPTGPAAAAKLDPAILVTARDGVTVTVRDLSPRFLDFYAAAQGLDPDARFAAWRDRYNFAAVPPTPEGDAIARKLLDAAWPRYATALETIRRGQAGLRPAALDVACAVADLLRAPRPLKIGVTTYVGGFETNAFTTDTADGPVVAMPIEMDEATRALIFPHEMTHAVHGILARLPTGYERPLGRVIFEEGLAMHATAALNPGLPAYRYVGAQPWFDQAMARRLAIVQALQPLLDVSDGATLFKFTMGKGVTGLEREAYIAAWLAVGRMIERGATLPDLARIPADRMPGLVAAELKSVR